MLGPDERTIVLGEARDRLDERLDALADRAADGEGVVDDATDAEHHHQAVTALCDEYGADAEIRVQGLTAGDYARVEDRLANSPNSGPGSSRTLTTAAALQAAPFLDERDADPRSLEETAPVVADLPPTVVRWLHHVADDLTTVGADEGNSFERRVRDRMSAAESTRDTS